MGLTKGQRVITEIVSGRGGYPYITDLQEMDRRRLVSLALIPEQLWRIVTLLVAEHWEGYLQVHPDRGFRELQSWLQLCREYPCLGEEQHAGKEVKLGRKVGPTSLETCPGGQISRFGVNPNITCLGNGS